MSKKPPKKTMRHKQKKRDYNFDDEDDFYLPAEKELNFDRGDGNERTIA